MNMKPHLKIILCSTLSVLMAAILEASEFIPDFKQWVVATPPSSTMTLKEYKDFMSQVRSSYEWQVVSENGKVKGILRSEEEGNKLKSPEFDTTMQFDYGESSAHLTLEVEDGWIVAYNDGEFGAAIYWFDKMGKLKKLLSHHHVKEFLIEGSRIFAIEGLSHMTMSQGSMIEINKDEKGWAVSDFVTLPQSPMAITKVDAGDYIIVTKDMLLRVNLEREILILVPNSIWGMLGPNSVAVDKEGYIYIGMRRFVGRCKLGKSVQQYELLVPDQTWLIEKLNKK